MSTDRTDILNLIYEMAARFDAGDFEGAGDLIKDGDFIMGENNVVKASEMVAIWRDIIILYDGSPRTRHVVTNPVLSIDEVAETAECKSVYTVDQQIPGGPIMTIVSGRYVDKFCCNSGTWIFKQRRYVPMDLVGDLSNHLTAKAIKDFSQEAI